MNHEHEHHASAPKKGWIWSFVKDIEKLGDEYLVAKAPFQLPAGIKDFLVKAAPYVTIIMLILSLPVIFAVLGVGAILGALAPFAGLLFIVSMLLTIRAFVLQAMAIKPLFARAKEGWNLMFYAALISFVASLLSGSIIGAIIGTLIGLYILFQMKSYYK